MKRARITTSDGHGKDEAKLVWHETNATMVDVLDALDKTRKDFAREEAAKEDLPHPRSCVMTLVAVVQSDRDEKLAEETCRLISAEHPAEAVIVRERFGLRTGKIEAWIHADIQRPETSCARECEIITLHVRGAAGEHLAALVDPLLVSGVPTYIWWTGTPPFGKRELEDALRVSDALIVDSSQFAEPYHAFRGLANLMSRAHQKLGMADLQWSRLRSWREMIAQFFSPQDRRPFLDGISEIGVDYAGEGRGNRIASALITGWMASCLGWKLNRAAAGAGGVVAAFYNDKRGNTVEVNFRSVPKPKLMQGELVAVRIGGVARGQTFRLSLLRDPERKHTSIESEIERRRADTSNVLLTLIEIAETEPLRHVQMFETDDEATLVLDLLSNGTHDPVFARSLAAASELVHKF